MSVERHADGVAWSCSTTRRSTPCRPSCSAAAGGRRGADRRPARARSSSRAASGSSPPGADIAEFGGPDEADADRRPLPRRARRPGRHPPADDRRGQTGTRWAAGASWPWPATSAVAADDARFGQPEILLGIIPGGGGTQRLARLVGPARAKDMIFTGRQVGADEALRHRPGRRGRAAPTRCSTGRCALAAELAHGPVVAQALAKRAIDDGLDGTLGGGPRPRAGAVRRGVRHRGRRRSASQSFLEHGPGKASSPAATRGPLTTRHAPAVPHSRSRRSGPGDAAELGGAGQVGVGGHDPHGEAVAAGAVAARTRPS